ncbi:MAG TPA: DNA ligase D [Gammaproteobacteria bacterium]|nr:DNA ligase D [Gammaproteobacteria bacterium]
MAPTRRAAPDRRTAAARRPPRVSKRALEAYQKKRDFAHTPEPAGVDAVSDPGNLSFVIQKHAARRLHYDFRLELDGVLLSWACPKGPSLDPDDKTLAVRVEDHPLEYGGFEGVIPKGGYGAGTVMLWDRGRWDPTTDPHEGLRKGHLSFVLHGERLRGGFALVKIRNTDGAKGDSWLLLKSRDERADAGSGRRVLQENAVSVESGRSMDEIASEQQRVWTRSGELPTRAELAALPGATRRKIPWPLEPQLPTLVAQLPEGADWLHELKLDGYRLLIRLRGGKAELWTRGAQDWTSRLAVIARAAEQLPLEDAVIDGELVAPDERGHTSFSALQRAIDAEPLRLHFYAFDLLQAQGVDLRELPLRERKSILKRLLPAEPGRIRYSDHVAAQGRVVYERACELGVEGIVSKRAEAPYRSGRGRDWVKVKCLGREEFVVGGYITRGRNPLASLLLGRFDGDRLIYVGRVGTGFNEDDFRILCRRLQKLGRKDHPFAGSKPPVARSERVHWVEPRLLVEVKFSAWTADNILRHASFQGIREDKPPQSEEVASAPAAPLPRLSISNPDKIFYPESGLTKGEIAAWVASMAPWILPHVADRPLMVLRCPNGYSGNCFYQKHYENMQAPLHPVQVPGDDQPYITIRDAAGLIALVQNGVLEVHPWGSRNDRPERPDRMIFDLDPDAAVPLDAVVRAAHELRHRLEDLGLRSWVRWSGGKGLHVVVPLARRNTWDEVKGFSRSLAQRMTHEQPQRYLAKASKEQRKGKIFIDWLRNGMGSTAIASWWFRARKGAPVALPLQWSDLDGAMNLDVWRVPLVQPPKRDPWAGFFDEKQTITAAMRRRLDIKRS